MTLDPTATRAAAIAANLQALRLRLHSAALLVEEACEAMLAGRQNEAIGTIMPLQDGLPECDALLRTIFVLHRERSPNLWEGGVS